MLIDASNLDKWVFEKVQEFFEKALNDTELNERLHQSHNVFFLHLLGLDTNGHANLPHSKEYIDNILYVDNGVKEIVKLVESFFPDGKTSYVFTADHGMNDRGIFKSSKRKEKNK